MSLDKMRQPHPVRIIILGDPIDTEYWFREFKKKAETQCDTQDSPHYRGKAFTIYPRAVND